MGLAPPPQLAACLEVLHLASITARMLGHEGHEQGLQPRQCDQLAALMDAVHNIPHLIADWDSCNQSLLRGMLDDYDNRWNAGLLVTYDRKIAEHSRS